MAAHLLDGLRGVALVGWLEPPNSGESASLSRVGPQRGAVRRESAEGLGRL